MKKRQKSVLVILLLFVMCFGVVLGRGLIYKNVFAKEVFSLKETTLEETSSTENEKNNEKTSSEVVENTDVTSSITKEAPANQNTNKTNTIKTINLQDANVVIRGKAKKEYEADNASISFTVNSLDLDKKVSRDKNAEITNKIVQGLETLGIKRDKISYSYSSCYMTREGFKNNLTGLKTTTNLSVQVDKLENLNDVINSIFDNGGEVNSINFKVSDFENKYNEVLNSAISMAKSKADEVLGRETTIKGIKEEYIYSCDTKYQTYVEGLSSDFFNSKITIEAQVEIIAN